MGEAYWKKDEWRCVRVSAYPRGTPTESMEGHYIHAETWDEAIATMTRLYPGEVFECWWNKEGDTP